MKQTAKAKDHGATIVLGGGRMDRPGFYLGATVMTDIDAVNPAYTQEFFGLAPSFYVVDTKETIELAEQSLGGVKNAGYRREHSMSGFGEYVNKKLVSVSAAGPARPGLDHPG